MWWGSADDPSVGQWKVFPRQPGNHTPKTCVRCSRETRVRPVLPGARCHAQLMRPQAPSCGGAIDVALSPVPDRADRQPSQTRRAPWNIMNKAAQKPSPPMWCRPPGVLWPAFPNNDTHLSLFGAGPPATANCPLC